MVHCQANFVCYKSRAWKMVNLKGQVKKDKLQSCSTHILRTVFYNILDYLNLLCTNKYTCLEKGYLTNRENLNATMSKVIIMGNGGFYGCLIEPQPWCFSIVEGNSTNVCIPSESVLSCSLLLNHLEPQSIKTKPLLPIMPIDIVASRTKRNTLTQRCLSDS